MARSRVAGSFVSALLVVTVPCGAVALRQRGGGRRHHDAGALGLLSRGHAMAGASAGLEKFRCEVDLECYCMNDRIRNTIGDDCGWCEDTSKFMPGSEGGPEGGSTCRRWVWKADSCPTMMCSADLTAGFYMQLAMPLVVFVTAALFLHYSTRLRQREPPKVDDGIINFRLKRSEFMKGLKGKRPAISSRWFQDRVPSEGTVLTSLKNLAKSTAFRHTVTRVGLQAAAVCVLLTLGRISPLFITKDRFETITSFTSQTVSTVRLLEVVLGVLFGYLVVQRIQWWWLLLDICRQVQGRTHDLGQLAGAATASDDPQQEAKRLHKNFDFLRFLMMHFFYSFKPLNAHFATVSEDKLMELGWLLPEEAETNSYLAKRNIYLTWSHMWVIQNIEDKLVAKHLHEKLTALRTASASLFDTHETRVPWTIEAMLYSAVYLWMLLMPFSIVGDIGAREKLARDPVEIPTLNFFIVAAFYQAALRLLHEFKDPFGLHSDAMHPQSIYLESVNITWDFLVCPTHQSIKPSYRSFAHPAEAPAFGGAAEGSDGGRKDESAAASVRDGSPAPSDGVDVRPSSRPSV